MKLIMSILPLFFFYYFNPGISLQLFTIHIYILNVPYSLLKLCHILCSFVFTAGRIGSGRFIGAEGQGIPQKGGSCVM